MLGSVSVPQFCTVCLIEFLSEEQRAVHLGEAAQVLLFAIISVYLSLKNVVIVIIIKTSYIFF